MGPRGLAVQALAGLAVQADAPSREWFGCAPFGRFA